MPRQNTRWWSCMELSISTGWSEHIQVSAQVLRFFFTRLSCQNAPSQHSKELWWLSSWGICFPEYPLKRITFQHCGHGLRPKNPSRIASAFGRYPVDAARNPPLFRRCHQRSAPWNVPWWRGWKGRKPTKTLWEGLIESIMYNVDDVSCVLAKWSFSYLEHPDPFLWSPLLFIAFSWEGSLSS